MFARVSGYLTAHMDVSEGEPTVVKKCEFYSVRNRWSRDRKHVGWHRGGSRRCLHAFPVTSRPTWTFPRVNRRWLRNANFTVCGTDGHETGNMLVGIGEVVGDVCTRFRLPHGPHGRFRG